MPEGFDNINYANKAIAKPLPDRINDIDTKGTLYDNIIYASDNGTLDLNNLNAFTTISQSRDEVYNMIDIMCEDPIISIALDIYTADCCEPNDKGQIVWVESDDEHVLGMVQYLLDQINVDKHSYSWVHSLIKYGDLYLKLYRQSEYSMGNIFDKKQLNEDVILKAFKDEDHYVEYLEMHRNPAEVFELQKFGKTAGYIRAHILSKNITEDTVNPIYKNLFNNYSFKRSDVDLYPATEFVHACLEDNSNRIGEEVSISNDEDNTSYTYDVKRGQSILYNTFRIWRELSLLENSVLLNRITKSSIVRTVQVEVGDMEKNDVRTLLQRIKSMVEQKSAISVGKTYEDYTNPGPIENIIYIPTHDGTGALSMGEIGGQVDSDDLTDLNYFKNKVFASLGIPGAYLGEGDSDGSLFNNGNSLSLKSSRYAKTVKRIQNAYCQALTDAINLILLDKGLTNYINQFTIRMQAPTTQEEKDRKENLAQTISNIRDIMDLLADIDDKVTKLEVLKSLLAGAVNDTEVLTAIQAEIDRIEAEDTETGGEGEDFDSEEMGDMDFGDMDFGSGEEMGGEEELPTPGEVGSTPMEAPEEGFETGEGELLAEDNLPSFAELGINYTDAN